MSGLLGYVGKRDAAPVLVRGLAGLLRGTEPVEVAVLGARGEVARRGAGALPGLRLLLERDPIHGTCGLARAGTAGAAARSHCCGDLALAYEGIVENGDVLRGLLEQGGHEFAGAGDAETLIHLIQDAPGDTLEERVRSAMGRIEGAYGLAVVSADDPHKIVVAQDGAPVLVGVGEGECVVASERGVLLEHTRTVIHLDDGDVGVLTPSGYRVLERPEPLRLFDDEDDGPGVAGATDRLRRVRDEITVQPDAIDSLLRGRAWLAEGTARLEELGVEPGEVAAVQRVALVATGRSWHAGLLGRQVLETLVRLPVSLEHASELGRAGAGAAVTPDCLVVVLSATGAEDDCLRAIRGARAAGARTIAVAHGAAGPVARAADGRIALQAAGARGAASASTFASEVVALLLLGLRLGRWRGLSVEAGRKFLDLLCDLPGQLADALEMEHAVRAAAERLAFAHRALVLGRGLLFPVALKGAQGLTDVARLPAQGSAALEARNGPLGEIEHGTPVIVLAPKNGDHARAVAGMEEAKARGGIVVAITDDGDGRMGELADHLVRVPSSAPLLMPLLSLLPLELLAYHAAVRRGGDHAASSLQSA